MKSGSFEQSNQADGVEANLYATILWNSEDIAIAKLSRDGRIVEANSAFLMVTGIKNPEGRSVVELVSMDDAGGWAKTSERMRIEPVLLNYASADGVTSLRSRLYAMSDFDLLVGEIPVRDLLAAQAVMFNLNNEITTLARENARQSNQLKRQSGELQAALNELESSYWHLKKIQEFLPICMYCHKVKSDASHWEDVAEYLKRNSLFLSHGLCPECESRFGESFPKSKG